MNVDLLRRVADHIEAHPDEFDMSTYFGNRWPAGGDYFGVPPCGTACCVAGTTVLLTDGLAFFDEPDESGSGVHWRGAELLDLTDDEADLLFCGSAWWGEALTRLGLGSYVVHHSSGESVIPLSDISATQGVAVLRALATGTLTLGGET